MLQRKASCACGGGCPRCQSKLPIQAKLAVSQPDDVYEQEADRVAEKVMRMPEPPLQPTHAEQRSGISLSPKFEKEQEGSFETKSGPPSRQSDAFVPNSLLQDLGPGQPLDAATRDFLEPRFGCDFSQVRVHTDHKAAESARAVDAAAYTVGRHIVFDRGDARNGSPGRRLLVHEISHVLQQAHEGTEWIQRKPRSGRHALDDCSGYVARADPCAIWSSEAQRARLIPHNPPIGSGGDHALNTVSNVIQLSTKDISSVERAELLRIACCSLDPENAAIAREVFVERRGIAGREFGDLATPTRCDLLSILDARAAAAGAALGVQVRQRIESEIEERQAERAERLRQERQAEEQYKRDLELHRKAGRPTWLGAVFPAHTGPYRIKYAPQILDPVLRSSANLAERTATVQIRSAVLEPIARPVATALAFIECLVAAMRGEDAEALADRFDHSLALALLVSFQPGVIVGAAREIANIAEMIVDIISDPQKFVEELSNLLELLWAPESLDLACALATDLGGEFSAEMASLSTLGDIELAYELGKIAGPAILNTVLSLVAPHVVASIKGARVLRRFLGLLEKIRTKLKWLDKWGKPDNERGPRKTKRRRERDAKKTRTGVPQIQLTRPVNGRINVGGGFEPGAESASNLQPFIPGTGGPAPTALVPNLVPGRFEDVADLFEANSAREIFSNRLTFGTVNWSEAANGAYNVMAPTGRLSLNVWTRSAAEVQQIIDAFTRAGFREVVNASGLVGAGTVITGVK
jgi:Domain of unknown function (DUF4157)